MALQVDPAAHAARPYLVLGSTSGTLPGIPVDGFVLPLNVDLYFVYSLSEANGPVLGTTFGTVAGDGAATLTLPAGLNPGLAGAVVHHACVVFEVAGPTATAVLTTNAVSLTLAP